MSILEPRPSITLEQLIARKREELADLLNELQLAKEVESLLFKKRMREADEHPLETALAHLAGRTLNGK